MELALGVQFSPLTQFTSGHFGLLWKAMGDDWISASDGPPFEDRFETFDGPLWLSGMQFRLGTPPYPGRMILAHKDGTRLIQVQATRFHLNWRKRAGFVNYHVWATPFDESENYAAGDYPNQSRGGDGLIRWTERDRSVENADVVFWYTFGHTHVPRPEDYPVMPAAYIGFLLKPNGFFDRNPANDLPPSKKAKAGACCH